MKELIVVRHAKSSWQDAMLDDFHRPLNTRGRSAAPLMANWLRAQQISPDLLLLSPAKRTKETWALFNKAGLQAGDVQEVDGLYLAGLAFLMDLLKKLPSEAQQVMVIGHNPGLEFLIDALCGGVPPVLEPRVHMFLEKFPTCGVVGFRFEIDCWSALAPSMGRIYVATSPKLLKAEGQMDL